MNRGPFDASNNVGITFDALSVTSWNHSKLNAYFRQTINII